MSATSEPAPGRGSVAPLEGSPTTSVMIVDEAPEDDGTHAGCYFLPAVLDTYPFDTPAFAAWTWDDTAEPIGDMWFASREVAEAYAAARKWVVR